MLVNNPYTEELQTLIKKDLSAFSSEVYFKWVAWNEQFIKNGFHSKEFQRKLCEVL